jgi:hypothetical protein
MKNAARDGAEIISPMSEPLRKISFVGRIDRPFLSNGSVDLCDNKNQRCFIFWGIGA